MDEEVEGLLGELLLLLRVSLRAEEAVAERVARVAVVGDAHVVEDR